MDFKSLLLVFFVIFCVWLVLDHIPIFQGNKKPLPPGPKGLPLIGNLHQQSWTAPWKTYQKWHKQYGPIVSFKCGPYQIMSLGNHEVARDLLEKRGAIYSSRPKSIWSEYKAKGLLPFFQSYVAEWKTIHKMQARLLTPRMIQSYTPILDIESKHLLMDMLLPQELTGIFDRYAFSTASALLTGERIHTAIEVSFHEMRNIIDEAFSQLHLSFLLTDNIPGARCLSTLISKCRTSGKPFFDRILHIFNRVFDSANARETWNWTRSMMNNRDSNSLSWEQRCFGLGELWVGVSVTTSVALLVFTQLSILSPQKYLNLQEEIDSFVKADRIPSASDLDKMVYLKAFVSEMLRMESFVPLGFMRVVDQDDEYMGYRIPKGTIIFPNTWCLDHDESLFPHPEDFVPERWLGNPDLPLAAFGFGRRICPGRHLAYRSLHLTIARIVWGYDLVPPQKATPASKYEGFFLSTDGFTGVFKPRSEQHKALIEKEWKSAAENEDVITSMVPSGEMSPLNIS
ncbi:hypothetical protein FE257_004512 [Aspergillus nanangensis]|uniref:Cytochrome P450 n=1 Tax=Aspergillus nanangensis TaxID=2582783 RepID=A0AAD4CY55_ASPNN|nr:hypothetical protein FE257_004512 [Aspergillus nanangensis]